MPETSFNPAVNPVVESDFSSNTSGRRYNSTTDDLLDRIREGIDALTGGGGGGGSIPNRQGSGWVFATYNDDLDAGLIYSNTIWQEIIRDPVTGNITDVKYYNHPGGVEINESLFLLRPTNITTNRFFTYRLDGNATGAATPWVDPLSPDGNTLIEGQTGTVGKFIDLPYGLFKYLDVAILPQTDGGDSVYPYGTVGFWADKNKTRFYPINVYGGAVGPLSIRRGSPTYEGFLMQDIYIEAAPGCLLEVTIVE